MMRLSELEIEEELKKLSEWSVKNDKLHKEFKFDNFFSKTCIRLISSNSSTSRYCCNLRSELSRDNSLPFAINVFLESDKCPQ